MMYSRESTSIIISIPPGKILLVVISRSLCECHMKAKPASELGEFAMVPEGGVEPVWPHCTPGPLDCAPGLQPVARIVASGPRYGLPPYQGPLVNKFASGKVAGPPPDTSPKGAFSTGLK